MRETVAIVAWGAMADVLYATPIVKHIRRLHPDAEISWLIRDKFAEVVETNPDIDNIVKFSLASDFASRQDAEHAMDQLILRKANNNYDRVYDLQYWPRYSNFFEHPGEDFISLRARNAGLNPAEIKDRSIICEHTIKDDQAINKFTIDNQLDGKLVSLNHISYASSPILSFGAYQELVNKLQNIGVKVAVTGAFNEPLPEGVIDARGMPYRQWKVLIGRSNFYIGLDSGAKTLAAATDTPMIILHSKDFPLQKTGCIAMGIRTNNIWELITIPNIDSIINLMKVNGL